jgi:uncharacterized lipoprotein YmbA
MSRVPSRRRILSALALLPALVRCQDSPPSRFYTLAPRPAAGPAGKISRTVVVQRVEVAKYLDRPQIVRLGSSYELSFAEFERWGEGLGDMVTRVLVADLAERLPDCDIYAAGGPLTLPSADKTVEVNIVKFEPDPAGTVVLVAQWAIHGHASSAGFRTQEFRVAAASSGSTDGSARPGGGTGGDAVGQVAAMSDALGQLASAIAKGLAG